MSLLFSMTQVTRRTGLSPHVLRVWERRYQVVSPGRSAGRQRLYTEEEMERLCLLARLTREGHRIGDLVRLEADELSSLGPVMAESLQPSVSDATHPVAHRLESADLTELLDLVRRYDSNGFQARLMDLLLWQGNQGFLVRTVGPLAEAIGTAWGLGELSAAQEHFASNLLRILLHQIGSSNPVSPFAPLLVVATPSGQMHELGAAMVAACARNQGWRVDYLGASLPGIEIAGAAVQRQARAVALSLVHPGDDPQLPGELERLAQALPEECVLYVGGRVVNCYGSTLEAIGAERVSDLPGFAASLDALRRGL